MPLDHPFSKAAVASQYFLYFGVMACICPTSISIATIWGCRVSTSVRCPPCIGGHGDLPDGLGALADRTQGRRTIYILCNG